MKVNMHKPIKQTIETTYIGYNTVHKVSCVEHYVEYTDGTKGYLYSNKSLDNNGFLTESILTKLPIIVPNVYPSKTTS
jgi:hypothetical protein